MARHVDVHLVDDITGSVNDVRTVSFTYGAVAGGKRGYQYELELSAESREEFDRLMMPYIIASRRKRGNPSTGGKLAAEQGKAIRAWLVENGMMDPRKTTGRIPERLIQKYMDAHQGEQAQK